RATRLPRPPPFPYTTLFRSILHPDDAGRRGLADGARVRLFNERGAVGLVLRVSDEVLPGVVLVPGQRPDGETIAGTVNMLCSDRDRKSTRLNSSHVAISYAV